MLAEAAEIEHCLMCSYLYAAFSLKQSVDEDLLPHELAAVKRWRAEIVAIATEEMLHLALVNNLLIAVGSRPHYRHFNFPASAGQFPADLAVALLPFDAATLDHFVYVERPIRADEHDGGSLEKPHYSRDMARGDLATETNVDYATVGELYDTIGASLAHLAEQLGENGLFVGLPEAQLSARDVFLPGLCTIATQADAARALALIVEQGEGSLVCEDTSHYARFRTIREQWQTLSAQRRGFVPARRAARHPVMRAPVAQDARVQVISEPALSLLDVANGSYFLMLRLFALMSDPVNCLLPRGAIMGQAMHLMHAVADLGAALTALPANPAHPGIMAGMTFTLSRTALGFESAESAGQLIAERMELLADHAEACVAALPALTRFALTLREAAAIWRAAHDSKVTASASAAGASSGERSDEPSDERSDAPSGEQSDERREDHSHDRGGQSRTDADDAVETVHGASGTIYFRAQRCIHSRHCVLEEPDVFQANREGAWIFPDNATPERLDRVARRCVSGAIRFARSDGGARESAPPVNLIRMREAGPLALNAAVTLVRPDGAATEELRVTLCRCGQSRNKPFCDQSHLAAQFDAPGETISRPSDPLAERAGPLVVTPLHNGPLDVRGAAEVLTGTGRTVERTTGVRLCRCGASADKPFCDGSHRRVGFEADGIGV